MPDVIKNTRLAGRPIIADLKELLFHEQNWTSTFLGLRDGSPEIEVDVPGGVGASTFIKSKDESGTRSLLRVEATGQQRRLKRRFATEPSEIISWSKIVEREEKEFDDLATGKTIVKVPQQELPERDLFDALIRAKTGWQVRRICRRSKYWLKYRWDFGGGHFYENHNPCPRALYEYAEEFCQAKLDPRYPARDSRPSGDDRRIQYLARVMAGLSLPKPISPSYAVELLRKMKQPQRPSRVADADE